METQLTLKKKDEILQNAGPDFLTRIEVKPLFMEQLVRRKVLFPLESQDIQALRTPSEQKSRLLDHLRSAKVEQFIDFCIVLHDECKQDDIIKCIFGLDIDLLRPQNGASKKQPPASQDQSEVQSTSKQYIVVRAEVTLPDDEAVPVPSTSRSADPSVPPPIWTEANTAEQGIVDKSRRHRKLLYSHWEDLKAEVKMRGLWGNLRQLDVLDVPTELKARRIETNSVQVQLLLEVLMKSPRWRLNAFIRALCLSGQDHVVTNILHLNTQDFCSHQDYQDRDQAQRSTKRPTQSSHSQEEEENAPKRRGEVSPNQTISTEGSPLNVSEVSNDQSLSETLFKAILYNCKQCLKKLMIRNLYDLDDHPEADIIDLSKCYVRLEAQLQKTSDRVKLEVTLEDILKRWDGGSGDRYTARLQGDPGCGKTTWMTRLAYVCSKDFLAGHRGNWNLMVYIRARDISGSIEETIRNHLWCPTEYLDCLMEYVNKGHRVCLLFDGYDEIRNHIILESLKAYIQDVNRRGGPTIFVSTRRALCPISSKDFNKLLDLPGFSEEQGIDYVERYFNMEPSGQSHAEIVRYVKTHKARMQSILCNPLQLNIFCTLASKKLLILEDDTIFNMTMLYTPLEKFLLRRENEKQGRTSSVKESEDFRRMCLHGMLNDIRAFSQDNLDKFNISSTHREALLVKHIDTNIDAEDVVSYTFPHETIYEFFGSSYIKKLTQQDLMTLLLPIFHERSLRNVQKIIIELIQKREVDKAQLIQASIRAILILQCRIDKTGNDKVINDLLELPNTIKSTVNIKDLLLTHQDKDLHMHIDSIWHKIDEAFDVHAEVLRSVNWFDDLKRNGTIKHVVDCLKVCSPSEQENIIRKTVHLLLPSGWCDHDTYYTVAAGSTRWAGVRELLTYGDLTTEICTWCPQDVIPALNNYRQVWNQQDAPLHDVIIDFAYVPLWGLCPDSMWTMEEWKPVLEELLKPQHQVTGICVDSPSPAPLHGVPCLDGMLCAARHVIKQGHSLTGMIVSSGKVSETELKETIDWSGHVGLELQLYGITVVLSAAHTIQDVPAVHADLMRRRWSAAPTIWELDIEKYVTSDGQHEIVYHGTKPTGHWGPVDGGT